MFIQNILIDKKLINLLKMKDLGAKINKLYDKYTPYPPHIMAIHLKSTFSQAFGNVRLS